MKLIPFIMFVLLTCAHTTIAQEQKTLARFIIQDARLDNIDVTARYVEADSYLVMYETSDNELFFAVIMDKENIQSFGSVFDVEDIQKLPQTEEQYRTEVYNFKWRYSRSKTGKKGTAKVRLTKIFKPNGIMFTATIVPEDLKILEYQGFMEGSLGYNKN